MSGTLHLRYGWNPGIKVIACATCMMCAKEFVIEWYYIFHIIASKYGALIFGNDGTGPADESKRTKRIQGWSCQIMGWGFYYLQYYYFVKKPRHSCEHAYKAHRLSL